MPLSSAEFDKLYEVSPFIASLPKTTARRFFALGQSHHWARGSILFSAGEPAENVFVPLNGLVGFRAWAPEGKAALLSFASAGTPFALSPALLEEPYLASAEVLQDGRIWCTSRAAVAGMIEADRAFATSVIHEQARVSRAHIGQFAALLTQTPGQRLCNLLVSLLPRGASDEATKLGLPCERQDLAAWLGVTPSSVSRLFQRLEPIGVTGRGRHLTVKSPRALRDYARAPRAALRKLATKTAI